MELHDIQVPDEFNYLKPGDSMPFVKWMADNGKSWSPVDLKGKISLIILFTSECRHCRDNFAHLEKNLFRLNPPDFKAMAFGRDMDEEKIALYQQKFSLSIPLFADSNRVIYSGFAEKAVPRNYLFDSSGKLLMSIRGYRPDELDRLIGFVNSGIVDPTHSPSLS